MVKEERYSRVPRLSDTRYSAKYRYAIKVHPGYNLQVHSKLMRTITRLVGLNRRKLNICTYVHATDTFSFVPHPCK